MELDNQPTSEDSSWPLPLPREVVAEALLPAAKESWRALRLACRMLRLLIDASIKQIVLSGPIHEKLPSLLRALPRLRGLRSIRLVGADAGLSAFAALALPRLTQLTSLVIALYDEGAIHPTAPNAGLVFAAHLSCLQGLQFCVCPYVEGVVEHPWGPATQAVVDALAQLPVLRDLTPGWGVCGVMIQRSCEELGASAWRSLEALDLRGIEAGSIAALARAPLTRLTQLLLSTVHCAPDDHLCSSISGAPWAPHLLELSMELEGCIDSGLPSGLRLPALTRLQLCGDTSPVDPEAPLMAGWHLPKLCYLNPGALAIGSGAAASLADLFLPCLTSLTLQGPCPALTTLLRRAPWLLQLHSLVLGNGDNADDMWRALAAAPLTGLRRLHLWGDGMQAAGAAALGGATWLRGLEQVVLSRDMASRPDAMAALRAGSGGFADLEAAGKVQVTSY